VAFLRTPLLPPPLPPSPRSSARPRHAPTPSQPPPAPFPSGQLDINQEQLDERLLALANLLPDMVAKLHALKAPLVLELLQARQEGGVGC
jgi:hypothetical protein